MALPPPTCGEMGHFTGFLGRWNYQQSWGTRPQSAGFPNLFLMPGAGAGNFTRGCEPLVEWVRDCIGYMREKGWTRIEATPEAEEAWREYVAEAGAQLLRTKANSWFVGANIPGKARFLLGSPDSAPVMRAKRAEVAAKGYEGFVLQ